MAFLSWDQQQHVVTFEVDVERGSNQLLIYTSSRDTALALLILSHVSVHLLNEGPRSSSLVGLHPTPTH